MYYLVSINMIIIIIKSKDSNEERLIQHKSLQRKNNYYK